jgi:hypothetical protein
MVKPIKPAYSFLRNGSASALRKSVLFRGFAVKKYHYSGRPHRKTVPRNIKNQKPFTIKNYPYDKNH